MPSDVQNAADERNRRMVAMRNSMKEPRKQKKKNETPFTIPELTEPFPWLDTYLCHDTETGSKRKGATITAWVDDEGLHAVVNDRDSNCKAFFVSTSINGLWGEIEAFLSSPDPKWTKSSGKRR
jgi:hypothetical protein